jgi:hypothetical protein
MQLSINCTGLLELDANMLHPFIRIHVMDITTGKYLAKRNPEAPAISSKEAATKIRYESNGNTVQEIYLDFIPPFATKYCDLRIAGENRANFYENFLINETLDAIYNENTVLIFELLDYNIPLILAKDPNLRDNLYPIAWAYLRPFGEAAMHLATLRLQFYQYKFHPTAEFLQLPMHDIRTPLVFYDFNWPILVNFNIKLIE